MSQPIVVRDIRPEEFQALGQLLVGVYGGLEGFPTPTQQPRYYEMLANIGDFTRKNGAQVLVALMDGELVGGVVYLGDMAEYGAASVAATIENAAGIRLLGVAPAVRGRGVGKALTEACIRLAREQGHQQVVLHSTEAMRVAWDMYERMGFQRAPEIDFLQAALPVFGFRLALGEE
ncbi:GNAT family N-acetyltransferase [Dyella halodurans]|uniref:GNAT family N-acetyltransferase n=1 Tax=Dyella halodurans TaxID=1920171 RepID=A0ABV9BX00_9GAMM|nr:GNAT family N-acetyltransferase [Dyella halodurans]